eukprot:7391485-Prymnesium_polylepis.3
MPLVNTDNVTSQLGGRGCDCVEVSVVVGAESVGTVHVLSRRHVPRLPGASGNPIAQCRYQLTVARGWVVGVLEKTERREHRVVGAEAIAIDGADMQTLQDVLSCRPISGIVLASLEQSIRLFANQGVQKLVSGKKHLEPFWIAGNAFPCGVRRAVEQVIRQLPEPVRLQHHVRVQHLVWRRLRHAEQPYRDRARAAGVHCERGCFRCKLDIRLSSDGRLLLHA